MSFLRRAFEQRDITRLADPTMAAMGLTVPSNADLSPTAAGVGVTDQTALGLSTFYACVTLLADTIASPLGDSYRRGPEGLRVEVDPQFRS